MFQNFSSNQKIYLKNVLFISTKVTNYQSMNQVKHVDGSARCNYFNLRLCTYKYKLVTYNVIAQKINY